MAKNLDLKIGVLSYQALHKKTVDLLWLLKAQGYQRVTVFATPMSYKKSFKPIYQHRPAYVADELHARLLDTATICANFRYNYCAMEDYQGLPDADIDVFMIGGAGLIPQELYKAKPVINAHPGYIPFARGLDALKWAVLEGQPIGATAHLIGDEVDAGQILCRQKVEISPDDAFYEVACRQYELEMCLFVDALEHLEQEHEYISGEGYEIHRRMPEEIEENLPELWEKYKARVIT